MGNILLVVGSGCVIAAIVGGGLKAFGVKIPLVNSAKRQLLLGFLGTLLSVSSFVQGNGSLGRGDNLVGSWEQYNYTPATSQWEYSGTFDVAGSKGIYTISPRKQRETPAIPDGIPDVQFDGSTLQFNSNPGQGRAASFLVQRISDTEFKGTVKNANNEIVVTKLVKSSG